jgi:hypothetical protein
MQVAMDMSPLSLLTLSEEFLRAGATDMASFQTLGAMYLAERDAASMMLLIFFAYGAFLFYYLLYRSQLVPRFISVWGVIALILVVTMNILRSKTWHLECFCLPIITNEIFLAFWLIFKEVQSGSCCFRAS